MSHMGEGLTLMTILDGRGRQSRERGCAGVRSASICDQPTMSVHHFTKGAKESKVLRSHVRRSDGVRGRGW